ncbi:MAG TPA: HD domain-containing protein [Candidatus Bathyarchaeia archaeon]
MHQELVDFGKQVGKLKKLARKGWVSSVGVRKPESVADHSFRTAILVMCISDLKGLNTDKMVKMALLHDLHEAVTGDLDYFDKQQIGEVEAKRREKAAIREVFAVLPESLRRQYIAIMDEFLLQKSEEAVLVRQVDLIEMVMQTLEYEKDGYSKTKLESFWGNMEDTLLDSDLKRIFELLRKEKQTI